MMHGTYINTLQYDARYIQHQIDICDHNETNKSNLYEGNVITMQNFLNVKPGCT